MKKFTSLLSACLLSGMTCLAAQPAFMEKPTSLFAKSETPSPRLRLNDVAKGSRAFAPANRAENVDEWSEWKDFGSGTLTFLDPVSMSEEIEKVLVDHDVTIQHRVNVANEDTQQFLLKGLFEGHDIVIDYEESTNSLKVAKQSTGIEEYGEEYKFVDFGTAYTEIDPADLGMTQEELDEVANYYASFNYFIPATGEFYIYCGFYSEMMGDMMAIADTFITLDGYGDAHPTFTLDQYVTESSPKAKIEFGNMCTSVKYAFFPGTLQQYMIDGVLDGSYDIKEITEPSEIDLVMKPANTVYSIVAISYDGDQPLEYSWTYYTPVAEEKSEWKSLGYGSMTTDFFEYLFGFDSKEYAVEFEENIATPGLYRLVNPFGGNYPYMNIYDNSANHYMLVDATSENVNIHNFDTGLDFGAGNFVIVSYIDSYRDYGMTEQEILEEGKYGSIENGVITFPANSFMVWCPNWEAVGGESNAYYYANPEGHLKLTIPSGSGVTTTEVVSDSKAEYFNLQGISMGSSVAGSGIYLRRQGDKVSKVLIR